MRSLIYVSEILIHCQSILPLTAQLIIVLVYACILSLKLFPLVGSSTSWERPNPFPPAHTSCDESSATIGVVYSHHYKATRDLNRGGHIQLLVFVQLAASRPLLKSNSKIESMYYVSMDEGLHHSHACTNQLYIMKQLARPAEEQYERRGS